jgi:signal transduction histidine kinase
MKRLKMPALAVLIAFQLCFSAVAEFPPAGAEGNPLEIQSVLVNGKQIAVSSDDKVDLGPFPKSITFNFGASKDAGHAPIRLRYKMIGYDNAWQQVEGEMNLTVRFYNNNGDQISENIFTISGDSPGWNGSLKTSLLTHRREAVITPPQASRILIVISSAGGPSAVGIYVVDNLLVSHPGTNGEPEILLRSPFDGTPTNYLPNYVPDGWMHDGNHPSMARVVEVGKDPTTAAFAILDNDPFSHAEWHNIMEFAPKVAPGDHIVVEWNELYSIGGGNVASATYASLPAGSYQFSVGETTAMGAPTGVQSQIVVLVPKPFWKSAWFTGTIFLLLVLGITAVARYIVWQRMRREMLHLRNQRALEQERLRIAHDIHDDIGARVTQISLVSAMAHGNQVFPEPARTEFNQISKMARDLIAALYETVWAVNPENDNLDALGNYLCQMLNQMCEQTQLVCNLEVEDLPKDIQVSSQIRHNITLAVKESLNNAIKHSKATEVTVCITFQKMLLAISIQDNGCGFNLGKTPTGNGLKNIKSRLESIGGSSSIESEPGRGTTVYLRLIIKPAVTER